MLERTGRFLPSAAVILAAVVLVSAAGCREARLAERRLAYRSERLSDDIARFERLERSRPRRVERTLKAIVRDQRQTVEDLDENVDRLDSHCRTRWRRWVERQPAYRDAAGRILLGKPERIGPNAIILFF